MQLPAWILLATLFATATRRRPIAVVVAVVVLWVLIPAVAGDLVTGRASGPLSVHPATWLVLIGVAAQLLERPTAITQLIGRRIYLFLVLGMVIGAAGLATVLGGGSGGIALLVDQMVGPVALYLLAAVAIEHSRDTLVTLRTTLLTLAGVQSVLAMAQWATGSVLLYEQAHATRWWFTKPGYDRWMGTFDHPLALALFLAVVTPLVIGLRRTGMQLVLVSAMAVAVLITQSRTGTAAIAVAIVYVVVKGRAGLGTKTMALLTLAGTAAVLAASTLAAGLQSRIADDTGSADARRDALTFFGDIWIEHLVTGGGFTSSYRIAAVGGLSTSLESSFLMYAIDIGLVFAVLYFGAQVVIVLQGLGRAPLPGMTLTATLAVMLPHTYSALAAGSAVGPLLWLVLAMTSAAVPLATTNPLPYDPLAPYSVLRSATVPVRAAPVRSSAG